MLGIDCLTLRSLDFDNVLLVWLKTSLTISWSDIRFIDSVATILFTKALSATVYLDTLLCERFVQINIRGRLVANWQKQSYIHFKSQYM